MTRPWMPLYVADYLADTAHLSVAESGAYLHLLMHYWVRGSLPTDEAALCRIARMKPTEWARCRAVIARFFTDGWVHARVEHELATAQEKYERRAAAGRLGGSRKRSDPDAAAAELEKQCESNASAMQNQPQPHSPLEKKSSLRSDSVARRTAATQQELFERFWETYPRRDGGNPKQPAAKRFIALCKSGVDPEAIIAGAIRYAAAEGRRGHVGTPYVAQALTWLNQRRWEDEAPVPPHPADETPGAVDWPKRIDSWRKTGSWPSDWGPAPGEPGTFVPADLRPHPQPFVEPVRGAS